MHKGLKMKDEKTFLKEIAPYDFDEMDNEIECPNCGTKMYVSGWPDEEYRNHEFRATDVYCCPECHLNAIITCCFFLNHKEVEYYLEDMEDEALLRTWMSKSTGAERAT